MAVNYTLLGKDVVKFDNHQDGFNPVFRKVLDLEKTPLGTSDAYALFRLPDGFAPRNGFAYVHAEIADADSDFDLDIGTAADTDSVATIALDDIDDAGDAVIGSFMAGTVASTTATLVPKVIKGSTAVYAWLRADQAISKGKLEIVISGDQMLTPAKAF